MPSCPACAQEVPNDALFCARCGGPLAVSSEVPTRLDDRPPGGAAARSRGHMASSSSAASSGGRFLPGVVLVDRYRIVALLGKGGMGEVYRADDLKLGQAVALKFLPEALEQDADRLQRFLNEVRTARQVSHSNVCRVYDVVEMDGHHFLSMEYVDGEDLASLLRRIGRLPKDKAIELGRQLAAGLATAHDAGVLHRDLKPANVMVDGRGRAKITDFGLAGLAGEIHGDEIRSGTPAYMAPEQLDGSEVTVKSDLYSLGLVLYELFTGKPPFRAASAADLRRMQTETAPTSPSSFVEGFDPAVERLILRCLDPDPARRPQSAMAVAAALPGGDPLAAAVAAGETPSPEMVVEAGAVGGLRPGVATALLAGFLALVGAILFLGDRIMPMRLVPLPKPPQVLEEKAREILASLHHDTEPLDFMSDFVPHVDYLQELRRGEGNAGLQPFRAGQPSALRFFYRESPYPLVRMSSGSIQGWMIDPPNDQPGMAIVGLDPSGRLVHLEIVPPDRDATDTPVEEPDWSPLFKAAGLDPVEFAATQPTWNPPFYADTRAAWEGVYPDAPDISIRLEAAAYRGRPMAFRIIEPWTRTAAAPPDRPTTLRRIAQALPSLWYVAVLLGAGFVALRNLRLGRGDRKTALRLALYLGAVRFLWFFGAHHLASTAELGLLIAHIAWSLYRVGMIYMFYLALEPYARRLWPRMLTSWMRLAAGRFRDPLVGRDLLLGSLVGALFTGSRMLGEWIDQARGSSSGGIEIDWFGEPLRGLRHAVTAVIGIHSVSVFDAFMPIMMFLILRLLLRRTWAAIAVVTLLVVFMFNPAAGAPPLGFLIGLGLSLTVFWLTFLRLGFLALVISLSWSALYLELPLTPDLSSWHATATLLCLLVTVGVAAFGFRTSLAGRPLLGDELSEARAPARS